MLTAAQIIRSKADQGVLTIEPTASAATAARLMAEKNVGALVVVDAGRLVGIVSERDLARKVVIGDRTPTAVKLSEIMSSPVRVVHPGRTGDECMAIMTQGRMRHLPVMDGERLIGLVSIGDLVKATIADQQFIIEQLEHYISGKLE
jgi:IMP dehydrogenase